MTPEQIEYAFEKFGGQRMIDRLHLNNGRIWSFRRGLKLLEWNHKISLLTFEEIKPGSGEIIKHTITYDAIDSIAFQLPVREFYDVEYDLANNPDPEIDVNARWLGRVVHEDGSVEEAEPPKKPNPKPEPVQGFEDHPIEYSLVKGGEVEKTVEATLNKSGSSEKAVETTLNKSGSSEQPVETSLEKAGSSNTEFVAEVEQQPAETEPAPKS